ncbi:hypothetical protein C0Q70_15740 [Pomacea canaliculata]|uniref:FAS1 domain-containing protein n=2 Tax=Pomacea canaliculata TaxID=400727 RepID=A0A2T7NVQ0_POMCA|nr:hypothetical protein C0Q70_15740 [Pomacea canaliculata]
MDLDQKGGAVECSLLPQRHGVERCVGWCNDDMSSMAAPLKLVVLLFVVASAATFGFVQGSDLNLVSINDKANLLELIRKLNLSVFYDNVVKASLVAQLQAEGPYTVFAPSNTAFNNAPPWQKEAMKNSSYLVKLLNYHILQDEVTLDDIANEMLKPTLAGIPVRFNVYDEMVTVQCSVIDNQRKDKMASNSVLHVIKRVMVPNSGTIVDVLSACPAFTILIQALQVTSLQDLLRGEGPFTLFAPTDKAFARLTQQTRDDLFSNPNILKELLLYHIVNGTYCRASLPHLTYLDTFNGDKLTISISAGGVHVNGATVVEEGADGSVINGVVQSIDSLLCPFCPKGSLKN